MAKRRKKTATRRRRRVGAVALTGPFMTYGPIVLGYLMAGTVNPLVDKVTGTMDQKLVGAAQSGIGGALVFMKLGRRKTMVQTVVGGVLLGSGLKRLATSFGVVNGIGGYGAVPVIGRRMNGYGKVPVIGNGYTPNASLNGAFSGYQVPRAVNNIMGNASGSGYSNGGSGYME